MFDHTLDDLIAALRDGRRAAKQAGAPKTSRKLLKRLEHGLARLASEPSPFEFAVRNLLTGEVPNGFGFLVGAVAPYAGNPGRWGATFPGNLPGTIYGDSPSDVLTKLADVLRHREAKPNTLASLSVEALGNLIRVFVKGAREVVAGHPNGRERLALALRVVDGGHMSLTPEERALLGAPIATGAPREETNDDGSMVSYRGLLSMSLPELRRFTEAVLDAADDALALHDSRSANAEPADAFTVHAVRRLHTAAVNNSDLST